MKKLLTNRQKDILTYIQKNLMVKSPPLEMIGSHFGITKQTVHEHTAILKEKGFLDDKNIPIDNPSKSWQSNCKMDVSGTSQPQSESEEKGQHD